MDEKRRTPRLKEFSEITTTILSEDQNLAKEKIFYNYSEDISVFGAKIRGNIPLPVDILLKIDLTIKNLHQKITVLGKVKWVKNIIEDKFYEAGVEFFNTPSEAIKKLEVYIGRRQRSQGLNQAYAYLSENYFFLQ